MDERRSVTNYSAKRPPPGRSRTRAQRSRDPSEVDALKQEHAVLARRYAEVKDENIHLRRQLHAMETTFSWRITAPLRVVRTWMFKARESVRGPWRSKLVRLATRIYHRAPLPVKARLALHNALHRISPGFYQRLRVAAGAGPSAPPGESASKESDPHDIVGNPAFRAAFRRLTHDLAAHAETHGPFTHIIVLPFFAVGGAQLVAANFARTVATRGHACLIVATDKTLTGERPAAVDRVQAIDFADYFPNADMVQREHLLFALIRTVGPRVLHIVNAETGWRMLIREGERVRKLTKVFGSIFAFQYDWRTREKVGYAATFLRPALPFLDGLITDNNRFIEDAVRDYKLDTDRAKFHLAYNTTDILTPDLRARAEAFAAALPAHIRDARRLSVLWAGRLDAEKRPELLLAVAKACPAFDFHVYGARVVDSEMAVQLEGRPNIHFQGGYTSAEEVMSRREHHAMMFTSRWEGLANVLIEFGAQGLPIVAATVGGVGELVTDSTGYPVPERPHVDDYVDALNQIKAAPQETAAKSTALIALIAERHGRAAFERSVESIAGYL